MTMIGTLESVWRYPVKSMGGESLEEVFVAFSGLMGDRVYSLVKSDGNPGFPCATSPDTGMLASPSSPKTLKPRNACRQESIRSTQKLSNSLLTLKPLKVKFIAWMKRHF
jgi:uncharacterized protein